MRRRRLVRRRPLRARPDVRARSGCGAARDAPRAEAGRARAVVAVWGARRNCGWADIFPIVDSRVQSEVCPMFFQQGTGDNLRTDMAAAGFTEHRGRSPVDGARVRLRRHRPWRGLRRRAGGDGLLPFRPADARRRARRVSPVDRALPARRRLRDSRRVRRRPRGACLRSIGTRAGGILLLSRSKVSYFKRAGCGTRSFSSTNVANDVMRSRIASAPSAKRLPIV